MANRTQTSPVEQQQHSGGRSLSCENENENENEKFWAQQQQQQRQHEQTTTTTLNELHQFPTHDDVPQGNPHDGIKDKDQQDDDDDDDDGVTAAEHHENVLLQTHADAQREMLPGDEKPSHHHHHQPRRRRADGNGADFDDVPQQTTTSSRIERSRQILGLQPRAPIVEEHDVAEHADLKWSMFRGALKEPLAEFFGTMILVLFGNGSVAQVLLSTGQMSAPGGNGFGDYQSISWGWGLGVMLGIYVAGDSGAYLNPALTLTNCCLRKLPWRRFPIYLLAQFLGGFVASGIVYANYINKINTFEGGAGIRTVPPAPRATAGIFCTYPEPDVTKASQFFSEFIASAILMFVIFALKDDSNKGSFSASGSWFPLALFFLIFGLGAGFGWETGYAINLARDFGPRLMSYALGYGGEVWSAGGYYFWIPIVAPFCGALFGGILYDVAIYTGPSPINTPWFGLKVLLKPHQAISNRIRAQEKDMLV